MESNDAISALSALAQDGRLAAFRLLVQNAPNGLCAGDIGRALAIPASTMSSHLAILTRAGLVSATREGRSIRYQADMAGMTALLSYLTEDCCGGNHSTCTHPHTDTLQD